MVSYNYFRILISCQLLLQLLVDRKIILTAGHFYVTFNIALASFIICRIEKSWGRKFKKRKIHLGELQLNSCLHQFLIVVTTADRS